MTLIAAVAVWTKSMIVSDPNCSVTLLRISLITNLFPDPAFTVTKIHLAKFLTVACKGEGSSVLVSSATRL